MSYIIATYLGDKKAKPEQYLISPGLIQKPKKTKSTEDENVSPEELDKILRSIF